MTELPPGLALLAAASPSLEPLYRQAFRAARSEATVLILGEPGTGRSTLARVLHQASGRASGPLVEVDVAAVPASLFESELFGHESGAFTGAESASPGRLGRAGGGSLLLDHVEEIPSTTQAKLLRLLSEGRYAPLGGTERAADVRFLAIGSHELAERVRSGSFRPDLYYRLEVLTLACPPLREHRADLDSVLEFFLADLGARFGRPGLTLAARAQDWMRSYSWPGNLREVRNALERACLLADGSVLDPAPPASQAPPVSLAELEREQILKVLAYTRGHQGRAAAILGISRKALWEKRRRHGLP